MSLLACLALKRSGFQKKRGLSRQSFKKRACTAIESPPSTSRTRVSGVVCRICTSSADPTSSAELTGPMFPSSSCPSGYLKSYCSLSSAMTHWSWVCCGLPANGETLRECGAEGEMTENRCVCVSLTWVSSQRGQENQECKIKNNHDCLPAAWISTAFHEGTSSAELASAVALWLNQDKLLQAGSLRCAFDGSDFIG